jgi:hypothetical protein
MRIWWPLLALAGCSFPTRPGEPFACAGAPVPETAPAVVQIRGKVYDYVVNVPVPGAMEFVHQFSEPITMSSTVDATTGRTMTDDAGNFTATPATGNRAHDGYILSQHPDYLDTYAYPARPLASDLGVSFFQFSGVGLGSLLCTGCPLVGDSICAKCSNSATTNPPPPDSSLTHLIVSVVDCNDDPVPGATVTVTGAGTGSASPVVYIKSDGLDKVATATELPTGSALVSGLPAGLVTIEAHLGSVPFVPNIVRVTPNAMTAVEVSP